MKLANVGVTKKVSRGRRPATIETPTLAVHASPTIAELISITNHPSDNFYAETLLKPLGARSAPAGRPPRGLAACAGAPKELGVQAEMVDGSGLSRVDRISPRQIVRLLAALAGRPGGAHFRASLAVAGRTGTLQHAHARARPPRAAAARRPGR